jgi:Double zinc ribbon
MNKFWNHQTTESSQPRRPVEGDSLRLIPLWSMILAVLVFAGSMWFFNHEPPAHRRPGSLPMHLITSYITGTALASYALLAGYVSRDVKRRGMSAALWMLMVVVMPGGIGAVVYFLLRQPILIRCPHCTTELTAGVHFCPQCRFQVAPVCGQCFRGVQITDVFCPQCGHDVAEDLAPARLRAYADS